MRGGVRKQSAPVNFNEWREMPQKDKSSPRSTRGTDMCSPGGHSASQDLPEAQGWTLSSQGESPLTVSTQGGTRTLEAASSHGHSGPKVASSSQERAACPSRSAGCRGRGCAACREEAAATGSHHHACPRNGRSRRCPDKPGSPLPVHAVGGPQGGPGLLLDGAIFTLLGLILHPLVV